MNGGVTLFSFDSTTLLGVCTGKVNYKTARELIFSEKNKSNSISNGKKYTDVKTKDISYEAVMNRVILTAQKNESFFKFISQIEEQTLKFLLENYYQKLRISNGFDSVHLGENGCIEFSGALLLLTYSYAKNDTIAINACNQALIMAFKGASPGIFSDVMDDIINEETNIPYEEWSAVYRYLKDNYGTCLRKIEFASDYTMSDHKRYSEFNKESETIVENNNADVSEKMCTCVIGLRNEKSKAAIDKLKVGDIVKLLREPNNIYDKDAIAVYSINNEMLGYIARDNEKELAEFIDREAEYEASVTSESGGNRSNYVVNIQVTKVNIASYTSNNFNKEESNKYYGTGGAILKKVRSADEVSKCVEELKKEKGFDYALANMEYLYNVCADIEYIEKNCTTNEKIAILEEFIKKDDEIKKKYHKDIADADDGYGDYLESQYDGYGNRVGNGSSDPDFWGKSELNDYYGYDEDYEGDWD